MCKHKRLIYIFLTFFCFVFLTTNVKALEETSPPNEEIIAYDKIEGDINEDNIVNDEDAKIIVDNILEEKELTDEIDINKDNKLDINDATTIIATENSDINEEEIEDELAISLTKDKEEIYINDEINVNLSITGFNKNKINGLEGTINYSKDKLKLITIDDSNESIKYGGINEKDKFIYILENYNKEDPLLTFKFKAIDTGYGYITIDDLILSYNGYEYPPNEEKINLVLKIIEYIENNEETNKETNKEKNNIININSNPITNKRSVVKTYPSYAITDTGKKISVTYISLSSDNTIKELIIKNHKIDFSKDKLEYNITVDADTDKLDIKVILNDEKATYEIIGNEKFKKGNNKVIIVVFAEDGKTRRYIINVKKKEKIRESNSSRNVIIVLLLLIIIGLIYIIFKDDNEDEQ